MKTLAKQVVELAILPGARVFVAPTKTKDVVSFEGSVRGGLSHVSNRMTPTLVAELLDAGTDTRSKEEIRGALASRGATLTFAAGCDRLYFTGSCLPEDLGFVFGVLAECLSSANFPKKEVEIGRERLMGELLEERSDTKTQATIALLRAVYDTSHPNYPSTTDEKEAQLRTVTRADLESLRKKFGREGMVLSVVGDTTAEKVSKAVGPLKRLSGGNAPEVSCASNTKAPRAKEIRVPIKDKANIDTFMAASVPLTYEDPRIEAFGFFCDMLGSRGFTGHLMRTIRERDGLTYGIYVMPIGFEHARDGLFSIWATFSPDTYEKAVAKVQEEIGLFLKTALTQSAVQENKQKLIGRYYVALSTTRGLAAALHRIGREGKPLSYLDEYPRIVAAMSFKEVRDIAALIPFDALTVSASGTFTK